MNRSKDSLCPIRMRNKGGEEKSSCSFDNMSMFALSDAILFMRVWTRLLVKGAMRLGNVTHLGGEVFTSTVRAKGLDTFVELSVNHSGKDTINVRYFRAASHKIYPGATSIIINKAHII